MKRRNDYQRLYLYLYIGKDARQYFHRHISLYFLINEDFYVIETEEQLQ